METQPKWWRRNEMQRSSGVSILVHLQSSGIGLNYRWVSWDARKSMGSRPSDSTRQTFVFQSYAETTADVIIKESKKKPLDTA